MRSLLLPHIPFMVDELGGDQLSSHVPELFDQFEKIKLELETDPPDAIIICSPHYQGSIFKVGTSLTYRGDLSNFNKPNIIDIRQGARELAELILKKGIEYGFLSADETYEKVGKLDYGSIVPLKLIDPDSKIPIVPISISMGSQREHKIWGEKLYQIVKSYSNNILFIASTELTQDFSNNPRAYPSNHLEDETFIELIVTKNYSELYDLPSSYFENTERELLPIFIQSGFSKQLNGKLKLYTGLIGCGCAIIEFNTNL